MLEIKPVSTLPPYLLTRRPTLNRTLATVVHQHRIRYKHQLPTRLRNSPAPLVVLGIHVKAFVKAANLVDHLPSRDDRRTAEHRHAPPPRGCGRVSGGRVGW